MTAKDGNVSRNQLNFNDKNKFFHCFSEENLKKRHDAYVTWQRKIFVMWLSKKRKFLPKVNTMAGSFPLTEEVIQTNDCVGNRPLHR